MRIGGHATKLDATECICKRITKLAVKERRCGRIIYLVVSFLGGIVNYLATLDKLEASAKKVVGPDNVLPKKDSMGAEDFAYYLQHKPGCLFGLGVMECQPPVPLHNGKMLVNEDALEVGAKVFVQYILDQMEN